jgi:hypothetical protein
MRCAKHVLLILSVLLVLSSASSVHAQAIDFCEISYLRFDYPETVLSSQPLTIRTTVVLFSCDVGPVVARVDLFDFHHNLMSSSYAWVNSPVTNVTNTITAPKVGDPNIVYATAYMVLFDGQIVGHYMSWFQLSVIRPTEITATNNTAIQINSQTSASAPMIASASTLASTASISTLSALTSSSENVGALILSTDLPYEIIILIAILFIVALAVLNKGGKL